MVRTPEKAYKDLMKFIELRKKHTKRGEKAEKVGRSITRAEADDWQHVHTQLDLLWHGRLMERSDNDQCLEALVQMFDKIVNEKVTNPKKTIEKIRSRLTAIETKKKRNRAGIGLGYIDYIKSEKLLFPHIAGEEVKKLEYDVEYIKNMAGAFTCDARQMLKDGERAAVDCFLQISNILRDCARSMESVLAFDERFLRFCTKKEGEEGK